METGGKNSIWLGWNSQDVSILTAPFVKVVREDPATLGVVSTSQVPAKVWLPRGKVEEVPSTGQSSAYLTSAAKEHPLCLPNI